MTDVGRNDRHAAFDGVAASYAESVASANRLSGRGPAFFAREKARLIEALALNEFPDSVVDLLDVGCGVGMLHPHLDPARFRVVGVDPSRASIEEARARNPSVTYRVADARDLPVETGSVDLALAVCVFHHIDPSERPGAMAELTRVVRPGGLVSVIEHNPRHPYTRYSVAHCPFDDDAILLPPGETLALMRGAGARLARRVYTSWLPFGHGLNGQIERALGWAPGGTQYLAYGCVAQ